MIEEISKYRIIEKLGAGGMGEVYKAQDVLLRRTVAIKILAKSGSYPPEAFVRFLREARAASTFCHPNIVTIYETGDTDNYAYIAMEYVQGNNLRTMIATDALRGEDILEISLQISDALIEAHTHGIIHRDIKPENIMLTGSGVVKLLDFGLAKPLEAVNPDLDSSTAAASLTESGAVVGTLSYMSPEQLRNESLDERTDIFSFGIVFYEMIVGRIPFSGANPFEVAASILKDPAAKIESLPQGMPPGLTAVVMRCLEKDRRKRYSSFDEIKRELTAIKCRFTQQMITFAPDAELEPTAQIKQESPIALASPFTFKSPAPTILVLPLEVVSMGKENSHIGVGLSHAIRTNLARITGLSVLSKSAGVGRIDEQGRGAREVARELGATIMLEGEVIRSGQMLEVMYRLTDVESDHIIWGGQHRGDASDLFGIQDIVCENVAAALKLGLSSRAGDHLARPARVSVEVFEFYCKGRAFVERYDVKANIDFAIQMFEKALDLDSSFALAQSGLCEAYWRKYQNTHDAVWVERAISAGDRALVLDPTQGQVHVSLGMVYYGVGKIDRAKEEFKHAIELQPLNDDAYRLLGRCYKSEGKIDQAIKYIQKAIEIRPGYWDNYNFLGVCYYTFGQYREASEQFRRVISIQPDNYHGYNNLGGMYLLLGLYEDAVAIYQQAISIYPNEDSYTNLGTAYFYLGRYEEAIAAYKDAIVLNPNNDVLYCNLGDAYRQVGREGDAREDYEIAVSLLNEYLAINSSDAPALGRLAVYLAKLQNKEQAIASIEQATRLEPRNTTLMYRKAVVLALTKEIDRAIESLSSALTHGYSRSEATRDPDLESIRTSAKYKALFEFKE